MAEVVKVCTANFGKGAQDIEVYKKLGGYANISDRLFNMSQFEVIDYVQRSGLPDRHEVELCAPQFRQACLYRRERR